MAKDFMAQMLDELMGRNRNSAPDDQKDLRFDDETPLNCSVLQSCGVCTVNNQDKVCKHYLVNYCPNELFTNTKADLGQCRLIHDDHLANEYRASSKKGKLGYEEGFVRFLRSMVQEVDRRIDRGKGRLEATRQVAANSMGVKYDERIKEIADRIETLVKEAEELGGQGKVEEAQLKMRQSDQLRKDRDSIVATMESAVQQEKQLEVCQTCGAFLIVGDAQQRIDDHLSGKQHVGYARVKQTLKEEEEKAAKELEERRKARDTGRETSRGKSERSDRNDVTERRSHGRERGKRSPSRERNRRHRTRSRSVEKEHHRRHSRSHGSSGRGDRDGRGQGRKRSGSPAPHRDRSREKRRRSRSREERRRRRSRSEEKRSSRRRSSSSGSSSRRKREGAAGNGTSNGRVKLEVDQVPSLDSIQLPKNKFVPKEEEEEEEEEGMKG